MRKNLIRVGVLAAAMTMATGITAFADGWKQDSNGWYYEYNDGSWQGCGWFTDPEDKAIYYLDPDGYMMSETTVEGFKLGADGRRIEKTEEDIRREQERKQRIASRPSPAKEQAAAELAADAAKKGTASTSITRLAYQSEMKVFMDKHFIDAQKALYAIESTSTKANTVEDNLETSYYFNASGGPVMQASLWKMSNEKNSHYKPESLYYAYNRNLIGEAADIEIFDALFQDMNIAALGETEGQTVTDYYYAELAAGSTSFDRAGNTDTGNSYTLSYRSGKASINVICSEIDPNAAAAEQAAANEQSAEAAEQAPVEEVVSARVIVAGQGNTVEETAAEETAAVDETAAEETAAVDETAAEATEETAAEATEETAAEAAAEETVAE